MNQKRIQPAPPWLKERMARLRQRRPLTSREVETQFRAAEAGRMKFDAKPPRSASGPKPLVTS